jgi:transcriptional regulator with XRE-family HTH domain
MNQYVTGDTIRFNREKKKMTQGTLAELLGVSDKAVSKWETGRGYPDISLLEPLAYSLGISIAELISGVSFSNQNVLGNMFRSKIYVCPVCGNIICAMGEAAISCCGITLPTLEAEEEDEIHKIIIDRDKDEYFITVNHEMTKEHYISFIGVLTDSGFKLIKLYSEGPAEARFKVVGGKYIYLYCNKHGLFRKKL